MIITWLGQSGYLIESEGGVAQRLLIDPFYSDIVEQKQGVKRLMEPPIPIVDLRPDVIFITHNHLDHFDPIALPVIHQTFPTAVVAGPESVMQQARALGFNESVLVSMPAGNRQTFGPFDLHATPAYHSDPLAVGCLLTVEGKTCYITGDTLLTPTLVDEIRAMCEAPLDLVFIVINGRLGNMTLTDAVEVVSQLKPAVAIPMHYGMFAENTADPHEFADACQAVGLKTRLLAPGEPTIF